MDNRPIGMFDSGVGGLTVEREVINYLPNESIIYLGDTARFPYGSKTATELKQFVFQIISYLKAKQVKLIIVACNSASAAALEAAQEKFDLPIIGVIEPGARGASRATRNRKVGVIGTKQTIESSSYKKSIHAFDAGIDVYSAVCTPFANLVEEGKTDSASTEETVAAHLSPLQNAGIDALVLGCTHYPLLKGVIGEVMGDGVTLISSAEEVAKEAKEMLARKNELKKDDQNLPIYQFLSTGDGNKFLTLGKRFLGREIKQAEEISLAQLEGEGA